MLLGAAPCVVNAIVLKVLGSAFGGETDRAMGWFTLRGRAESPARLQPSPLFCNAPDEHMPLGRFCFAVFGLLWLLVAPSADVLQAADGLWRSGRSPLQVVGKCVAAVIKMPIVWLVAILLELPLHRLRRTRVILFQRLRLQLNPRLLDFSPLS